MEIDDRREVTVGKLKELLAQLRDDDLLIPNHERNLYIVRDVEYIGQIVTEYDNPRIEMFGPKGILGSLRSYFARG